MANSKKDVTNDGVSRRGVLECMTWAGTGVLWSEGISGVEPNECGAPGKTPVERGYQARRSQCSP